MSDRYTIEQVEDGDWLVFDNEAFYCCYSGSSEQDAFAELNRLNTRNQNKALGETLTASIEVNKNLHKRIAELEQQLEQYQTVEKWVQCFTADELKAHNLAQEIKAVSSMAEDLEWLDYKSENNDPPSSVTANELRAFAKKLKEQG